MKRVKPLATFCRVDPFGFGVDQALIKGFHNGVVVYDLHDAWGNVWYDRVSSEALFMSRWFFPSKENSLWTHRKR